VLTLAEILPERCVSTSLDAPSKAEVLRQLAALYAHSDLAIDPASISEVLEERERLASTGVGSGVAIPHGRLGDIPGVRLVLGTHHAGVDFDAVDGRPVHILVGVLAPDGQASQHLKVLARVSRLLRDPQLREQLMSAESPSDAYRALIETDERLSAV
jgi:nitrogen PTS system EIIA component